MKPTTLMMTACAAGLLACAPAAAQEKQPQTPKQTQAQFHDREGKAIGTATLEQTPNGVLIRLDLNGLPPGEHGFHLHEHGVCEAKDGFKSAGGHFAPRGHKHGVKVKGGPHAGDMPNQFVGKDGTLRAHVINPRVSLTGGKASLFDKDGSALVIHAQPDDYRSQPSGDAGDRIACAVIARK